LTEDGRMCRLVKTITNDVLLMQYFSQKEVFIFPESEPELKL